MSKDKKKKIHHSSDSSDSKDSSSNDSSSKDSSSSDSSSNDSSSRDSSSNDSSSNDSDVKDKKSKKEKKVDKKKSKKEKKESKKHSKKESKKEKKSSKGGKKGPKGAQWVNWKTPFQEGSILAKSFDLASKKGGIDIKKLSKQIKSWGGNPAFMLRKLRSGKSKGFAWKVDDSHERLRITDAKIVDKKWRKS